MVLASIPFLLLLDPGSTTASSSTHDRRVEQPKRMRYNEDMQASSSADLSAVKTNAVPEVLAHFYMDQYPTITMDPETGAHPASAPSSSLKLNQMVEILGVLDEEENLPLGDVDMEENLKEGNSDTDFQASFSMMQEDETTVIPAHIPRLHVLWYRTTTIDAIEPAWEEFPSEFTESPLRQAWTQVGAGGGWNVVSQALWMLLHSQAERDPATGMVRSLPEEGTLGCVSLNLVLPSKVAEDSHSCDMAEFIVYTLQRLVLHCQLLTLSNKQGTTSTPLTAIQAPRKMDGRLQSTALQQPAGSLLILDLRDWNASTHPDDAHHPFHAIRQICRHHVLHYMFEGGLKIPFEADYRVLVLSSPMKQPLVPCSLSMQVPYLGVADIKHNWATLLDPLLIPIRARLQRHRIRSQGTTLRLDESVIERSQQDFCERRRRIREGAMHGASVDEVDFHRWLTLCRMHARMRGANVATLPDWEKALDLDDGMVRSFNNV